MPKKSTNKKLPRYKWTCCDCGYEHEGALPDNFTCPSCGYSPLPNDESEDKEIFIDGDGNVEVTGARKYKTTDKASELLLQQLSLNKTRMSSFALPFGIAHNASLVSSTLLDAPSFDAPVPLLSDGVEHEWTVPEEGAIVRLSRVLDDANVTKYGKFTAVTSEIHDTICSLYMHGVHEFNVAEVYKVLSGRIHDNDAYPTVTQAKMIAHHIRLCGSIRISIIQKAIPDSIGKIIYAEGNNNKNDDFITWNGQLLSFSEATIHANSGEVSMFYLNDTPPLLAYGRKQNKLLTMPSVLQCIPMSLTANNLYMRSVLAHSILRAYSNSLKVLTIPLIELYNKYDDAYPKEKFTVRSRIGKILNYWADKKFIDSFSFVGDKGENKYRINTVCINLFDRYDVNDFI